MKQYLLLTSALMVGLSGVAEAACIQTPSCSSLGYSSSSSCSGGTKCPFGNYWNCDAINKVNSINSQITNLTNKITTLETKVTELQKDAATANCKIGDILYSDMSCNTNVVASKTAIGVIFDITNKLAIGLYGAPYLQNLWSSDNFDVPGLNNLSSSAAIADWQGKKNTQIVLDYCKAKGKSCPAFEYVNNYKTEGTKAGDWYLPAAGELNAIIDNIDSINSSLRKVGGGEIAKSHYTQPAYFLSSSEESSSKAWTLYLGSNAGGETTYYIASTYKTETDYVSVRPVLAF